MFKNRLFFFATICFLNLITSCSNPELSADFISKTEGRYLLNADEFIEVSYVDKEIRLNWGGLKNIKAIQMNLSDFYIKEINQKIEFNLLDTPINIRVLKKSKTDSIPEIYKKIPSSYKFAFEYMDAGNYEKAVEIYLDIQKQDSLSPIINENMWNKKGYQNLRNNANQKAILCFKINVALYPKSYNVYDSLGEAYLKKGDTALALVNYKMALKINPSMRSAKKTIKKLQ